jgi:hypothetical protein
MSMMRVNPMPMGTQAAAGQTTDATKLLMAQAYGSRGGRRSAAKRKRKSAAKRVVKRAAKRAGRKLKFGSPAWRKKYMKRK